ncbi:MAG TPA: prepilin-type N-terminal cleavage/methylation domain-containing protein [Methylomirabilota bacterium]|nr:prepilin-type N-terminal cleavage/methylation domain-containing protein [Methylomirabilota bacterium]
MRRSATTDRERRGASPRGRQRGLTLVELVIVVLIVGILSAVSIPIYLGYTKEAKLAEGKAMAGSVLTALQGCTQAKGAGRSCTVTEITRRIGVSSTGRTADGRWTVVRTGRLTVSSTTPPRFTGTIQIFGRTPNNVAVALSMFPTTTGVVLRCTTSSSTPPASLTAGQPC